MSWRHRDILEAELHEPKGFTTANNGDSIWRNEKGTSEWTDREVLPAALNFVDASVAPPTTATGDIYVLSLGASIHANWGTVALKDWVRYNGTSWQVITPSKSILCYDKTLDVLMSYDGSAWNTVGSNTNIANANLTFDGNHYVDLGSNSWTVGGTAPIALEKISFQKDTRIKGSDTSESSRGFCVTDVSNDMIFDVRNNGQIGYGGAYLNTVGHKFRNPNNEAIIAAFDNDGTGGVESFKINTNGSFESEQSGQRIFWSYRQSGQSYIKLFDAGTESLRLNKNGSFINSKMLIGGTSITTGARLEIQQHSTNVSQQLFFANARMTTAGRTGSSGSFGASQAGFECYDTTLNKKFIWNGSAWEQITSV